MSQIGFSPADILLPKEARMDKWSVVACDQYTSEPEYWERVEQAVGGAPSALHMILPEVHLEKPDVAERTRAINDHMKQYLESGVFSEYPHSYVYVERMLAPGKIRRGLIGKLDLEDYDYTPGAQSLIRPTEGTVESRIPPRVKVREDAPLECPHIMVLLDDLTRSVIEPLAAQTGGMQLLYSFDLMENGGNIKGWLVDAQSREKIDAALLLLATGLDTYSEQYAQDKEPLLFAVGDGNHSLATAKACFEKIKAELPVEEWSVHPARYALVELVNVHDEALVFEPIHRVMFDVEPARVLEELAVFYDISKNAEEAGTGAQSFEYVTGSRRARVFVANPPTALAVGTLQKFIDDYIARFGGRVDYIHGDEVVCGLAKAPDAIGFMLPAMQKSQLFQTVILDGALPRKTFSMGHAFEKRYYLECRKIR